MGGPAVMSRGGPEIPLPGSHPAIGGRYVATVQGNAVLLFDRGTLAPLARIDGTGLVTVNEDAVLKEIGKTYHVCPTYGGGRDWPSSA